MWVKSFFSHTVKQTIAKLYRNAPIHYRSSEAKQENKWGTIFFSKNPETPQKSITKMFERTENFFGSKSHERPQEKDTWGKIIKKFERLGLIV